MSNSIEISDDITSSLSNRTDTKTPKKLLKTKQFDYTFKIVIIGDSGVGKSCILLRFTDDKFNENFITTIGVDFRFKSIIIDNKCIKIKMLKKINFYNKKKKKIIFFLIIFYIVGYSRTRKI